jgi:VCBS repeat protein
MMFKRVCYIMVLGLALCAPAGIYADIFFEQGTIFGTGLRSSTIDSGDLDGDGDVDIAVSNIYSHSLTLAFNDGNGNFNNVVELPLESERKHPVALTIGDLDGSGNLDLAVAFVQNLTRAELGTPAESGIAFLYSEEDGSYIQIFQPISGIPSALKISDLDGDGDNELIVSNNGEITLDAIKGTIDVYEAGLYSFDNRGHGLFSSDLPKYTEGSLVDFLAYDFNQDGIKDIVGVNQGATDFDSIFNFVYVDMNISIFNGTDDGLAEYNPLYVDFFPWSLDQGDFNNDGLEDIAVSNVGDMDGLASFLGTNASINIFENKGDRFSPLVSIPAPGMAYSILVDDYDMDGDVDYIATVQEIVDIGGINQLEASLKIFENNGSNEFTETASFTLEEEPRYSVKDDFDGDGDADVAILCSIIDAGGESNALNGRVYVFFNNAKTDVSHWEMF